MSGSEADFRRRARRIRAEARDHLRALRERRRSVRTAPEPVHHDDERARPERAASRPTDTACADAFLATDHANDVARQVMAADGAEWPEPSETAEAGVEAPPLLSVEAEGGFRDATRESDLFRLPGAGPGLVWMLQQAGIDSLEALAAAEPEALEARLGLVGALLDIPAWIDLAGRMPPAEEDRDPRLS